MPPSMATSSTSARRRPLRALPVSILGVLPGLCVAAAPEGVHQPGPAQAVLEARAAFSFAPGGVPAFRAAERDRLDGAAHLAWTPDPAVTAWLEGGVGREQTGVGTAFTGPSPLRLGTRVRPLHGLDLPVDLGLAWWAGLPVSFDRGALDADEADLSFLGELGRAFGPFRVDGALGLAILGNPLRFANQDDQPLAWLHAAWEPGPVALSGRVGGAVHTPRNPDRLEAVLGVEAACPLRLGAELGAGLSPAAPDLLARAWAGFAWACLEGERD